MNIPERESPASQANTPFELGSLTQPHGGIPYSWLLKPSYMNRWRRSWRSRVWAAGAGALGIIAGAGGGDSCPTQSAASSIAVPVPVYTTATTTPQRLVIPQSGGYEDRWQDDLFNDGSSNPTTTTQQWINTAPVPAPRRTSVSTCRAPQVTTRSS